MTASPTTDIGFKTFGKFECRCCLQSVGAINLLSIYDPWTQPFEGMADTIVEDLVKIANIQISDTDEHTKYICNECYEKLQFACNFVACVRENDRYLKQKYNDSENNSTADKVWPKPIQLDTHIAYDQSVDLEIKQEVLSDVEDDYDQNVGYREGEVEVKIETEEFLEQSTIQLNGFVDHDDLDNKNCKDSHLIHKKEVDESDDKCKEEKVKEELISDTEETEPLPADLPLQCLLCAREFHSMSGLKAHVIAQHSYKTVKRKSDESPRKPQKSKYNCGTCKRVFSTSTDLMVHETCHDKSVCYACNEKFDSFEVLLQHRKSCKPLNSTATQKLKTLDDVKRPQPNGANSTNTKAVKCEVCGITFFDLYYLNVHRTVRHPELNLSTANMPTEPDISMKIRDSVLS